MLNNLATRCVSMNIGSFAAISGILLNAGASPALAEDVIIATALTHHSPSSKPRRRMWI